MAKKTTPKIKVKVYCNECDRTFVKTISVHAHEIKCKCGGYDTEIIGYSLD